jgi:hypothetical protein
LLATYDKFGASIIGEGDMERVCIVIVASLFIAAYSPNSASAAGALAVGLPADVAKDGVSAYGSVNYDTEDAAKATALKACQTDKVASTFVKNLCSIVSTFRDQCYAISYDPKDGTPGFGWAVDNDLRSAEKNSLANCEKTAGPGRRGACVVANTGCDGSAK